MVVHRYIMEVEDVLYSLQETYIAFPDVNDAASWEMIANGFRTKHNGGGHPDVAGAIDGTLIRINRPEQYEGFYCRKGLFMCRVH
jgi:oligoribonuclease NrnB/cAMP/cGMP phosphodiesterase (DHH superfamily)